MRATRPRYAELPLVQRRRNVTRSYTKVLVRRAQLDRGRCEVCGAHAQAVHSDLTDPRKVRWLCAVHRRQRRREEAEAMRRAEDERLARILASLASKM